MGTITPIVSQKDGRTRWHAQIRMQQKGVGVFSLAQTFDREAAAKAWIKKKESELRQPGALAAAIASKGQPRGGVTLGDAIRESPDRQGEGRGTDHKG